MPRLSALALALALAAPAAAQSLQPANPRTDMALNIPTFVNLHGYGYGYARELAGLVSTTELGADWIHT